MSLGTWQTALALLVAEHASGRRSRAAKDDPLGALELRADERAWLDQIVDAPGFRLTCSIQRWWRELRLKASVRLTLMALPHQDRSEILRRWLDSRTATSFFYVREAIAFLDFVLDRLPEGPHLESICRFERAVHIAAASESDGFSIEPGGRLRGDVRLRHHPAASLVVFAAPAEDVFTALMGGSSLPEVGAKEFPMLIAPGLPNLCRPARDREVALWHECEAGVSYSKLCANGTPSAHAVLEMVHTGILIPEESLRTAV